MAGEQESSAGAEQSADDRFTLNTAKNDFVAGLFIRLLGPSPIKVAVAVFLIGGVGTLVLGLATGRIT